MNIIISNSSGKPIYEQITSQIKQQILAGQLQPHDALPSMRFLAKELRISVITTKRAYEDLEKDLKASAASVEAILPLAENPETGRITPPYFYAGMMSHEETEGEDI